MRAILRVASLIGALLPTLAVSQQTDLLCATVMTKKQRAALLEGKDARQLEREGYPSDPYAVYLKAKEIGNMRDAWGAIIMAQEGVGAPPDLQKTDELWKDYWCSQVLPVFEDRPGTVWGVLQSSAARGFPSAMLRVSEVYAKGELLQAINPRLSQEWKEKYDTVRNRRTFGGSCGELSAQEMQKGKCKNAKFPENLGHLPYQHPDPNKEGILRLGYISIAVLEEVMWARSNGVFGLNKSSRLSQSKCRQFFQDLLSAREMRVIAEGETQWGTFSRGSKLPNTDPNFKEWRYNGNRFVTGYVVVDWNATHYLLRAHRVCAGPLSPAGACASVIFAHLDVHDASGPEIACSAMTVAAPYWNNWKGSVTPLDLATEASGNKQ